jgi:hypothetical protein
MSRITSATTNIKDRAEFDEKVKEYARLQLCIRKLEVRRDQRVNRIKQEADEAISQASGLVSGLFAELEGWLRENRAQVLPGKAKSFKKPWAKVGFQKSKGAIKFPEKATEETIIARAEELGLDVVQTKKSLIKSAVMKLSEEDREKLGVIVSVPDRFYIEVLAESLDELK